jgi:prepilin-type N-terminal cleavage/methylation domain-containing protein
MGTTSLLSFYDMYKNKSKYGFTLIEAMISITLIGLLMGSLFIANSRLLDNPITDTTAALHERRAKTIKTTIELLSQGIQKDKFLANIGKNGDIRTEFAVTGPNTIEEILNTIDTNSNKFNLENIYNSKIELSQIGNGYTLWVIQAVAGEIEKCVTGILEVKPLNDTGRIGIVLFNATVDGKPIYSNVINSYKSYNNKLSGTCIVGVTQGTYNYPIVAALETQLENGIPSKDIIADSIKDLLFDAKLEYTHTQVLRIHIPSPYDKDAVDIGSLRILSGAPVITPQTLNINANNILILRNITR